MNGLLEQYERWMHGQDLEIGLKMRPYMPTLKEYASRVHHATEFGFNVGASALAILAGLPTLGVLHSYDIREHPMADGLRIWADDMGKAFHFHWQSSLLAQIQPTELLLIDSLHTSDQLGGELYRHENRVRRYLLLHDTEVHWQDGENGQHGLAGPIERLQRSGIWDLVHCEAHGCGLMVFERVKG